MHKLSGWIIKIAIFNFNEVYIQTSFIFIKIINRKKKIDLDKKMERHVKNFCIYTYMCREVVLKIWRLNLNAIWSAFAYVKLKAEVI